MVYCNKYGYRCTSTASCFLLPAGSVLDRNDPARRGASCVCRSLDAPHLPDRRRTSCGLSLPDVRGNGSCRNDWDEMLLLPLRRHDDGFLRLRLPSATSAGDACHTRLVPACRAAGCPSRPNTLLRLLPLPGALAPALHGFPFPPATPATLPVIAALLPTTQL